MVQTKKKTTKKKTTQTEHVSSLWYIVIGLIIFFISIIALFNWGFFGSLVLNSFRLFVGQAYDLLLVAIASFGLLTMIKRRVINIAISKLIGGALILMALTTLLHFNQFYQQEPLTDSIFKLTFDIFKNEFLTGQTQASLGGGLLGAVFYASFGYLFGQMGTYLFSFIVFFIGLMMVTGCTVEGVFGAVKAIGRKLIQLVSGTVSTVKNATTVYKSSMIVEDEEGNTVDFKDNSSEQETVDPDLYDYLEPKQPARGGQQRQNEKPKRGLISKLKKTLQVEEADYFDREELWQSRYEPSYSPTEPKEFEPYESSQFEPISKSKVRGRLDNDEERVLDLDYFDQMTHESMNTTRSEHTSVMEADDVNVDLNLASLEAETTGIEVEGWGQPTFDSRDIPIQGKEDSSELAQKDDLEKEPSQYASHWQNQSDSVQNTTANDLDSVLAQSETVEKIQQKVPKRKNNFYQLPTKKLLTKVAPVDQSEEYKRINENIVKLERTFESFGVEAKVVKANLGPSVTKYEIEPAIGVKVSKIVSLTDDIALALAARDVRMEAPIPGKSLIGIEVPNTQVSPVSFWEIIDVALKSPNILEVPLGRDISGAVCTADLSKMPHLLMAGATGSGKSVGMNVIIVSLLMKAKPNEVKFLMIDPKKVELTMYNELPHLLAPVVTNPRKAAQALNKVVMEMENRYELFAASGVRNIDGYNEYVSKKNQEKGTAYPPLPKIVVFIDELADLMMVASNDVETAITRLAQMARAAGIHMIIATQRPSVDVITGIIKANVPSRLAYAVSSGTDSRTILDSVGAEKLLGRGDMLFQPMGMNKPLRVQGAYISDGEVERITNFIKDQTEPEYDESMIVSDDAEDTVSASDDEYFDEAVELIKGLETISISQIQRRFRVGYNRAARLIDDMEAQGLISESDGSKPRQVLIND